MATTPAGAGRLAWFTNGRGRSLLRIAGADRRRAAHDVEGIVARAEASRSAANTQISSASFGALRAELHGELALPGEQGYEIAAQQLRVAVHATGHGSVSRGGDVLVIHTGRLQQCSIDVVRPTTACLVTVYAP
jgi:hypothetical protein